MNRRMAALMAGMALAAAQSTSHAAGDVIRMNDFPGVGNMLGRVAVANGYCEKYGIRCQLVPVNAAPVAVQTLLSGEFEVAYTPPEVAIQAAAKGAPLKAIGGGHILPPFFLTARNDVDLPNSAKGYPAIMHDLKGKRVGVTGRGTGAEFHLIEMLKGAGMAPTDVSIIVVGQPQTAYAALVNKQVDATIASEPLGAFCTVLKTCRVIVDPRTGEGPRALLNLAGATSVFFARADFVRDKPQLVSAFRNAMRDADTFVSDPANLPALKKIIEQTFKVDHPSGEQITAAAVKALAPGFRFALKPEALQASADYLLSSGQMTKAFDVGAMLPKP